METGSSQPPLNPADRPLVTFDANIVIALRSNEAGAEYIRLLLAWNRAGFITINITLSTALEEQRSDEKIEMHEYADWLQEQGVDRNNIFTSARTIGFHIPNMPSNTITFDIFLEMELNRRVHQILFPNIPFSWFDFRDQESISLGLSEIQRKALIELDAARYYFPPTPSSPIHMPTLALDALTLVEQEEMRTLSRQLERMWMNKKNDALGLFNHITQTWHTTCRNYAVFVTNDRNFRKQTKLTALRNLGYSGEILSPKEAVDFLANAIGLERRMI